MTFTRARQVALVPLVVGAMLTAFACYGLWFTLNAGLPVTPVGATLNITPFAFLSAAGATLFARPRRTVLAFWLAPLWAPLLTLALAVEADQARPAIPTVAAILFGYVGMLAVGLPAFAFLRSRNGTSLRDATATGAVLGPSALCVGSFLLTMAYTRAGDWAPQRAFALDVILIGVALGAAIAATFWAITRPDRSQPNPLAVFS
jgi:hypothetical protein